MNTQPVYTNERTENMVKRAHAVRNDASLECGIAVLYEDGTIVTAARDAINWAERWAEFRLYAYPGKVVKAVIVTETGEEWRAVDSHYWYTV